MIRNLIVFGRINIENLVKQNERFSWSEEKPDKTRTMHIHIQTDFSNSLSHHVETQFVYN